LLSTFTSGNLMVGTWDMGGNLTANGDVFAHASGANRQAGSLSLLAGGNIQVGSLYAGGLSSAHGGSISLSTTGSVTVGSIVNRSTTGATTASFAGYSNDTGSGGNRNVLTGGNYFFLPGANILVDSSRALSGWWTSGVNLTLDPTRSGLVVGDVVTHNGSGNSGSISISAANPNGFTVGALDASTPGYLGGSIAIANSDGSVTVNGDVTTGGANTIWNSGTVAITATNGHVNAGTADIRTSALGDADGGAVVVASRGGNVSVNSIDASTHNRNGTSVTVFGNLVDVRGETSPGSGVGIDASSALQNGGTIYVQSITADPFVVGYGATPPVPGNGTFGTLKASGLRGGNVTLVSGQINSAITVANGSAIDVTATQTVGGNIVISSGTLSLNGGTLSANG
jgi:hypothetical protein